MEQYAVFLDIDETLCHRGDIPKKNIEIIKKVRELGHLVFINTGRSFSHIPHQIRENMEFDGYVCGLGAYVRVHGKELINRMIPYEVWHRVAEMFFETGICGRIQGISKTYIVLDPDYKEMDGEIVMKLEDLDNLTDFCCTKMTFDHPAPEWCMKELEEVLDFWMQPNYTEVSPKGVSKADGIKAVLDYCKIDREHCIAIGDSINDLDMLSFASVSVAMGNAPLAIKEKSSFVTGNCMDAGAGNFLEHFLIKRDI